MFNCPICKKSSVKGESGVKVVLATRSRTYDVRDEYGDVIRQTIGQEAVKEALVHQPCVPMANQVAEKIKAKMAAAQGQK